MFYPFAFNAKNLGKIAKRRKGENFIDIGPPYAMLSLVRIGKHVTYLIRGGFKMPNRQTMAFQEALDIIGSLPEYQQEDLIDIVRHRIIEHRRELLAENIREARKEHARGETKKGNVNDLMKELSE
jgi:hypothetical protein